MTNAIIPTENDAQFVKTFAEYHPIRLDLPDGRPPLRFRDLKCAAGSALHHGFPIWDEAYSVGYSLADCRAILNRGRNE